MIQCETCNKWQHGICMGFDREEDCPDQYYCHECRPELHVDLWKCVAPCPTSSTVNSHRLSYSTIRAKTNTHRRESTSKKVPAPTTSHKSLEASVASSRSTRSPSTDGLKPHKSPKRRNTMNSRDPELEFAIEVSRIEAERAGIPVDPDSELGAGRRKRKRTTGEPVDAPEPYAIPLAVASNFADKQHGVAAVPPRVENDLPAAPNLCAPTHTLLALAKHRAPAPRLRPPSSPATHHPFHRNPMDPSPIL